MSKTDKNILSAATKPAEANRSQSAEHAANTFLYNAKNSSVAKAPNEGAVDETDILIEKEYRFPDHHPAEMKTDGKSHRFYFHHTNVPELKEGLDGVLATYRLHVLNRYSDPKTFAGMYEYLIKYPLGVETPPISDTRYYKNVNKLVQVQAENANLAAGEEPERMPEYVHTDFAQKC